MKKFIVLLTLLFSIPVANANSFKINKAEIAMLGLALTGYSLTEIKETDKQSHALFGMITAGWSCIFVCRKENGFWIATGITAVVAGGKEGYDKNNGGVADTADFWYTLIPGMITAYNVKTIIKFYDNKQERQMVSFTNNKITQGNFVFYQKPENKNRNFYLGFNKAFSSESF